MRFLVFVVPPLRGCRWTCLSCPVVVALRLDPVGVALLELPCSFIGRAWRCRVSVARWCFRGLLSRSVASRPRLICRASRAGAWCFARPCQSAAPHPSLLHMLGLARHGVASHAAIALATQLCTAHTYAAVRPCRFVHSCIACMNAHSHSTSSLRDLRLISFVNLPHLRFLSPYLHLLSTSHAFSSHHLTSS